PPLEGHRGPLSRDHRPRKSPQPSSRTPDRPMAVLTLPRSELGCGYVPVGAYPLASEHLPDREQEDLQVKTERPIVHVPNVQGELLFPTQEIPPVNLSPSGNPWLHFMPAGLFRGVSVQVL